MRIFLTGGTGMLGRPLAYLLINHGHDVVILTRNPKKALKILPLSCRCHYVEGDPSLEGSWIKSMDGCHAVVHLAGENIASRRWTKTFKQLICDTRLNSTRIIINAIRSMVIPPKVFLGTSAIGWYGDTGQSLVNESATSASADFFGQLCTNLENASSCLQGICRRVIIRVGVVLKRHEGALSKIELPIRWLIGGPLAGGQFFMSWIHWFDLIQMYKWVLENEGLDGIFNGTAPEPVRNIDLINNIALRLSKPVFFPVPYAVLRLFIGEFAQYLCTSQRILPFRAEEAGFSFFFPTLNQALDQEYRPA